MTNKFFRTAAPLALIACAGLVAASPAEARHGWGRHHYRHHDRVDAGDVLAGVAIIGVIAAIASSAENNRRNRANDDGYRVPPPPPRTEEYRDWRSSDAPRYDNRAPAPTAPAASPSAPLASNDEAASVDSCVVAAEQRGGTGARVDTIRTVNRAGEGYRVTGSVLRDARAQGNYATRDSFDCGWTNGQVQSIDISGQRVAN